MSLPDVIEATNIPSGSEEPQGIIYKIREKVSSSNVLNFVDVSTNATSQYGTLDTIAKWDSYWTSSESEYAYAQIEFKDKYVYPTHYSLKGFQGYAFAKE